MKIDTHVHIKFGSKDSNITLEQCIKKAEESELDGLCITDHNSLYWLKKIKEYQNTTNLLLLVGVEIYSSDGDLICFGIDELPKKQLSAQDTINFVKERNGVVIAAHPYRANNRGVGDLIYTLKGLDAIEAINGRTSFVTNRKTLKIAKELNLCATGGSDSHTLKEIGTIATFFEIKIKNEEDFLNAFERKKIVPTILK